MSKIEVNTVAPQCGTTLTLGESGDTVTLGTGASQSGFGRTGTVDWQTTKKTGDFTAANGEGYFVDTTSGGVVMTMPSGSAGAIVSIQDYNKTFDDNTFTVTPASGERVNGGTAGGSLLVTTEGQGLTFVYVDSTVGWKTVHENEFISGGSQFIVATGGTITCSGNCRIHTFTGPGTFTVSAVAICAANNSVSHLVVAGGGGGGKSRAGGGGAGGFREVKSPLTPYTASPLDGYPSAPNRITVTAQAYPIQVGGGGAGSTSPSARGTSGVNSIFSTITSAGGGGGGSNGPAPGTGINGGSGGGGMNPGPSPEPAGTGNTPPTTPSQGFPGGIGSYGPPHYGAGAGGGATAAGGNGTTPGIGGTGGAGATSCISGSPVGRAGGGGGGGNCGTSGPASDGGGAGGSPAVTTGTGTANTGGGGGGGNGSAPNPANATDSGANGGSGVVIIRYKNG